MARQRKPIPDSVREWLSYDPQTGQLTWKKKGRKKPKGELAGTIRDDGRWQVKVDKSIYFVSRVSWFLYYGTDPKCEIFHNNGDLADNSIGNLRAG